jgi:hypothetical protein
MFIGTGDLDIPILENDDERGFRGRKGKSHVGFYGKCWCEWTWTTFHRNFIETSSNFILDGRLL